MDSQLFTFHIFLYSHFVGIFSFIHILLTNTIWLARMFVYCMWLNVWCSKKLGFFRSFSLSKIECVRCYFIIIFMMRAHWIKNVMNTGENGKMTACFSCLAFGHTFINICHGSGGVEWSGAQRKLYLVLVMKKTFIQSMCTAMGDYEWCLWNGCTSKLFVQSCLVI